MVALFALNYVAFALAQCDRLRHLKSAFQASSPKLFKPGLVPGFFSARPLRHELRRGPWLIAFDYRAS
ncbi:MAG: hypothetical protein EAY70_02725 [Sphingomonadales bacterium]|nr:MAG: hypothetical protein EAY70_02725 [Sphingomonadales bacterium]